MNNKKKSEKKKRKEKIKKEKIKATLFWMLMIAVRVHMWLPLLVFWLGAMLPTRWIGLLGTWINQHPFWGHLLPLQALLPGSMSPALVHRHRHASFENFSSQLFWRVLEISEHGAFYDLQRQNLFEQFEQLTDVPLLVICARYDTLVHFDDSLACYRASQSTNKTSVVFGADSQYSASNHYSDLFAHFSLSPTQISTAHFGHLDLILGEKSPFFIWPILRQWFLTN
jgi:hypothetical protein